MHETRRAKFLNSQFAILNSLLDPLSSATVPLLYGIARRVMLRGGATQQQARVNGMTINYYRQGVPADGRGDKETRRPGEIRASLSRSPGLACPWYRR
jgi:hypothetical protein